MTEEQVKKLLDVFQSIDESLNVIAQVLSGEYGEGYQGGYTIQESLETIAKSVEPEEE